MAGRGAGDWGIGGSNRRDWGKLLWTNRGGGGMMWEHAEGREAETMARRKPPPIADVVEALSDGGERWMGGEIRDDFTGEVIEPKLAPGARPLDGAGVYQEAAWVAKAAARRRLLQRMGLIAPDPEPPPTKGSVRLQVRYRRGPTRRL